MLKTSPKWMKELFNLEFDSDDLEVNILDHPFVIKNGISFVVENENIIGPTIRPTRNKKLSPLPSFEVRKLSVILLMPASRPLPIKNTTTAKPIIMPPVKADKGVKFIIFMISITLLRHLYLIFSKIY